jgi:hypothetical protein
LLCTCRWFAIEVLHREKADWLNLNNEREKERKENKSRAMQAAGQTKGREGGRVVVTHV